MFQDLQKGAENILDSVIELCYFMRGAISYEEMLHRTPGERQHVSDFIKKRLKAEDHKLVPIY